MQHVASQSNVHYSQHHGVDPRSRVSANEPTQPSNSFSSMLDDAQETAPPPQANHQGDVPKTKKPGHSAASPNTPAQAPHESKTPVADDVDAAAPALPKAQESDQPGTAEPAATDEEGATEKMSADIVIAPIPGPNSAEIDGVAVQVPNTPDAKGKTTDDEDATGKDTADAAISIKTQDAAALTSDGKAKPSRSKHTKDKGADTSTAAAPSPPAHQPTTVAVSAAPATPAAPAASGGEIASGTDADTGATIVAASLKTDQPVVPKGKADPKAPANLPAADATPGDSQPAEAAPEADGADAANPAGALKAQGGTQASAATPDQDKPDHAHVHDIATDSEVRAKVDLTHTQLATQSSGSAAADKSVSGPQLVTLQHQADAPAAATAPTAATPANASAAVPLAAVAIEIAARAQAGRNRFEIRLDPPELGRIHVRLDVDKTGEVTSHVVVDRVDTLDALQRDAADLQRALQQAGLKTADNGLQFTLRDHSFAGRDNGFTPGNTARFAAPDPDIAPVETASAGYSRLLRPLGGIDIRV